MTAMGVACWALAAWAPPEGLPWSDEGSAWRSALAVVIVLGLLGTLAWLLRRGTFGFAPRRGRSTISVETAVPLGDRRSLVVVAVEGRRLLLGVSPMQVSMIAELASTAPFSDALDRAVAAPPRNTP